MGDFGDTTISYNGFTFSNEGSWPSSPPEYPVPFVSKSVDYLAPDTAGGEGRWCRKETVTMNGQLLICDTDTIDPGAAIITAFSEDFHTLEFSNDFIEDLPLIRVMSVDVGPLEGAKGVVDYSITLESYPEDSFAHHYRVINPQDTVEVAENDDATATLSHTVSCRGLNTSTGASNALDNAKTFVSEKIGDGCLRGNIIKSKDPNWGKFLVSVSENINRITAEYSMTKTYTSDQTRKEGGEIVVRYTTSIDNVFGDAMRVTYSGKVEGGRHGDWDAVRAAYRALRKTFNDPLPAKDPFIVSEDINEDEKNTTITFSIVVQKRPEVIDDYDITVSENSSGSLITVKISGSISATGPRKCRLEKVRKYFCGSATCKPSAKNINSGRYAGGCAGAYMEYLKENQISNLMTGSGKPFIFNADALAVSVTENKNKATIQYSMQFDNRIDYGHHRVDHTMNFKPSIQHIAVKELNRPSYCNNQNCGGNDVGGQSSFDLLWMGFKDRCEFAIQGQIAVYMPGVTMKSIAEEKFFQYCTSFEDDIQLQRSESADNSLNASYDYKWGFNSLNGSVNARGSEQTVSTLKI